MKSPRVMPGKPQPLHETMLGKAKSIESVLSRYLLLNQAACDGAPAHIAVHLIRDLNEAPDPYVHAHRHPTCDEIGLVVGQPGQLEYEMVLDGATHRITSPGSIFIPAGTRHRARALHGQGAYVCILMDPHGPGPSNTVTD